MPFLVIRYADDDAAAVLGEAQTKPDAVEMISADLAKLPGRTSASYAVAGGDLEHYTATRKEIVDVTVDPGATVDP